MTETIAAEELARLGALLAKATKGPWVVHPDQAWISPLADLEMPVCAMRHPADDLPERQVFDTAALIVALVNAAPALLSAAARVGVLEEALRPFATFAETFVDDEGWNGPMRTTRIVDWFGPSQFRAARSALASIEVGGEVSA